MVSDMMRLLGFAFIVILTVLRDTSERKVGGILWKCSLVIILVLVIYIPVIMLISFVRALFCVRKGENLCQRKVLGYFPELFSGINKSHELVFVKRGEIGILEGDMKEYTYVTLRQKPELKEEAAAWFHDKWGVPQEAYLECMESYLDHGTEYGWYLCLDSGQIVGGLGVIENDFHDRKDLTPNVCAVYTEKEYRCQGIRGAIT